MEPDRRRQVLHDMLDMIDAIPADVAGPAPLDPAELVQAISIEA
jgi:hypothetical protein